MFPNLRKTAIPIMVRITEHLRTGTMSPAMGATRVAAGMIGNILELSVSVGIHMILQLFGSVNLAFDIGIVMIRDIL